MKAANAVDVDAAKIDEVLDGLASGGSDQVPPPPGLDDAAAFEALGEEAEVQFAVEWQQALSGVVELFAKVIAPNWQLEEAERALLVDQGSKTLEAFFPNVVLEGKWLALFTFSLCAGGVVMKRFDAETLAFKPMRVQKVSQAPSDAPVSPSPSPSARSEPAASPDGKLRVVAPAWNGRGA